MIAADQLPGGGIEAPPWPIIKALLILGAGGVIWLIAQLGVFHPSNFRSPLSKHKRQRRAYRVVCQVFDMRPIFGGTTDGAVKRAIVRQHRKNTVPVTNGWRTHVAYAEVHYKPGIDTSEGSKKRIEFEQVWRQEMTTPDEHGHPAHDWDFGWVVGAPVVHCRKVDLTPPQVGRLFDHLQPTLKWPDGTQAGDVIHARFDDD